MNIKKPSTLSILAVTIAFSIVFLYAVVHIYTLTLNETKKSHQLQQMEMARAVSLGINTYLDHIVEDMHLLKFTGIVARGNNSMIWPDIDRFTAHYEKNLIRSIFVTSADGRIKQFSGTLKPDWLEEYLRIKIPEFREPFTSDFIWFSPVKPNFRQNTDTGMSFFIVIPLLPTENSVAGNKKHESGGFIGYIIDFEMLVKVYIQPLQLSKNDFAWVMDGNGRLIYHPKHRDMLLRTIEKLEQDCMECHASFEIQNRIIREPASIGEYTIGDEPTKIMAYMPIQLHNEKWVLVISTFLPEVTAGLRENFKIFFILGIIILTAILSFGWMLYYLDIRRIRAEEATRQAEKIQIMQEQLNQSSKLASVGELVDTVAHEINTPVGIISAQSDAMLLQGKSAEPFAEELGIIKQQISRIGKYTRSLLGYSRRAAFNPQPTSITELIEECLFLLGHRFRAANIKIIREFNTRTTLVNIDRTQMEQVIINLLNNAVDAIAKSGTIIVRIHEKSDMIKSAEKSSGSLVIDFIDDGKGIETDNLDKIFDAFFTTKKSAGGTGLGLYISKAIVTRHNGTITASPNKPKGTIFSITIPIMHYKEFQP